MRIVRDLGGYTLGRSDLVRRAMSKKKASVMAAERKNFVYGNEKEGVPGCISKGISEQVANHIYDEMTDFAKYAFNKSHAVCYAIVSYQTAWLKYHYKAEYMAAALTSVLGLADLTLKYMVAAKEEGLTILPPSVNESTWAFLVVDDHTIRFPLSGVSAVSIQTAKDIEGVRGSGFKTFQSAVQTMALNGVKKNAVCNLISAGAFDEFGGNRRQYHDVYEAIMKQATKKNKKKKGDTPGQMTLSDLFGSDGVESEAFEEYGLPDLPDYEVEEKMQGERDVCGTYLSGHPLDAYHNLESLVRRDTVAGSGGRQYAERLCLLTKIKECYSKKTGDKFAILHVECLEGRQELMMFSDLYRKDKGILVVGQVYRVRYELPMEEGRAGICQEIELAVNMDSRLWIRFPDLDSYKENFEDLTKIMQSASEVPGGPDELICFVRSTTQCGRYPRLWLKRRYADLEELVGPENIGYMSRDTEIRRFPPLPQF